MAVDTRKGALENNKEAGDFHLGADRQIKESGVD